MIVKAYSIVSLLLSEMATIPKPTRLPDGFLT